MYPEPIDEGVVRSRTEKRKGLQRWNWVWGSTSPEIHLRVALPLYHWPLQLTSVLQIVLSSIVLSEVNILHYLHCPFKTSSIGQHILLSPESETSGALVRLTCVEEVSLCFVACTAHACEGQTECQVTSVEPGRVLKSSLLRKKNKNKNKKHILLTKKHCETYHNSS